MGVIMHIDYVIGVTLLVAFIIFNIYLFLSLTKLIYKENPDAFSLQASRDYMANHQKSRISFAIESILNLDKNEQKMLLQLLRQKEL